MKKNHQIIIIFSLILLNSCRYLPGVIGNSAAGIFAYPVTKLIDAFDTGVDDFVSDHRQSKQQRNNDDILRQINHQCNTVGNLDDLSHNADNILDAARHMNCLGCVTWGTTFDCNNFSDNIFGLYGPYITERYPNLEGNCCTQDCPDRCERMCPNTIEILERTKSTSLPYSENTLPIGNSRGYYNHPAGFNGVCHGHSTTRKRLATLAQFDPNSQPRNSSGKIITGQVKLDNFYAKIIEDLAKGKVRKVPGYRNIRELTSRPGMGPTLKSSIIDNFHDEFFYNPVLVESSLVYSEFDRSSFNETIDEIQQHIQASGTAQVSMSKGEFPSGHTVEVFHIEDIPNSPYKKLCTIDSNYSKSTYKSRQTHLQSRNRRNVYCPTYMKVNTNDYSYRFVSGSREGVKISGDSFRVDSRSERILNDNIEALTDYCKEERGCD